MIDVIGIILSTSCHLMSPPPFPHTCTSINLFSCSYCYFGKVFCSAIFNKTYSVVINTYRGPTCMT